MVEAINRLGDENPLVDYQRRDNPSYLPAAETKFAARYCPWQQLERDLSRKISQYFRPTNLAEEGIR